MRSIFGLLAILLLGLGLTPPASAQTYTYRITVIETETRSSGNGLSNSGDVTGSAVSGCSSCSTEAFVWSGKQSVPYFGPLASDFEWLNSWGRDINYLRQVTGDAELLTVPGNAASKVTRAFFWDGTTKRILGTLGGTHSDGSAINASGHIVGTSSTAGDAEFHAYVWNGSTMRDLGTLGGTFSDGAAINVSGHVAGSSINAKGQSRAFFWDGNVMHDLGTLGGSLSFAIDLNAKDQVVGLARTSSGETRPFLWEKGVMRDLGTLGGRHSDAVAINNAGQVVGSSFTTSNLSHPFLWENGRMRDLHDLDFAGDPLRPFVSFGPVQDINNLGQILVQGLDGQQPIVPRTFLISPVYKISNFITPSSRSWKLGSTVRIAIAVLDSKWVR